MLYNKLAGHAVNYKQLIADTDYDQTEAEIGRSEHGFVNVTDRSGIEGMIGF
ncbi:hypothetical protein GCM10011500_10020 [Mucilaginibacter rubeus]|nr:hypothetical protein GCM10011500_10020 [Mucilaginibacter rubeus]